MGSEVKHTQRWDAGRFCSVVKVGDESYKIDYDGSTCSLAYLRDLHAILTAILTPPAPSPGEKGAEAAKFKVGDRVRVKFDRANLADVQAGDEYVVTRVERDPSKDDRCYGLPDNAYVRASNLELAEAATPATTSEARTALASRVRLACGGMLSELKASNMPPALWTNDEVEAAISRVVAVVCDPAPAASEARTTREEFNEAKEREAFDKWWETAACVESERAAIRYGWMARARSGAARKDGA